MERWQGLLAVALRLLDGLERDGIRLPAWSLGGDTMLMLAFRHRLSKDVDVFLPDLQLLPMLSPRLNAAAEALTGNYDEQSNMLKLRLAEGDVDFIVAPTLLPEPWLEMDLIGRKVRVERPGEIIAKKAFYRGSMFTHRDVFDMAAVIERAPGELEGLAGLLGKDRLRRLADRVGHLRGTYAIGSASIDVLPDGESLGTKAPDMVLTWLAGQPGASSPDA